MHQNAENERGETARVSRAMTSVFADDILKSAKLVSALESESAPVGEADGRRGAKTVCAPDGTSWMTHQSRKSPACPKRGSAHGIARETRAPPPLPQSPPHRHVANTVS